MNIISGIFDSTVESYAKFRRNYDPKLYDILVSKLNLNKTSDVLDLGTGTGFVAFSLSSKVNKVLAVDSSSEMIKYCKSKSEINQIENIDWQVGDINNLDLGSQKFNGITFGSSFHWVDHTKTLKYLKHHIHPEGGIAIFSSPSFWNGKSFWEMKLIKVIQEFLGKTRRAGNKTYERSQYSFEEVLFSHGFKNQVKSKLPIKQEWNFDQLFGLLLSTSYANAKVLGARQHEFKRNLKEEMTKLVPDGRFIRESYHEYVIAKMDN